MVSGKAGGWSTRIEQDQYITITALALGGGVSVRIRQLATPPLFKENTMNRPINMHPDDWREYQDEISGATRADDMRERYSAELEGIHDFDEDEAERQAFIAEWNSVSRWQKIKRYIRHRWEMFQVWRERDKIPF